MVRSKMARMFGSVGFALALAGCGPDSAPPSLAFLTRDGCVNTVTMRAHLDDALLALGRPAVYDVIDADTLPESDRRRGYGTPTVLVGNADLFGMPEPAAQHAAPT